MLGPYRFIVSCLPIAFCQLSLINGILYCIVLYDADEQTTKNCCLSKSLSRRLLETIRPTIKLTISSSSQPCNLRSCCTRWTLCDASMLLAATLVSSFSLWNHTWTSTDSYILRVISAANTNYSMHCYGCIHYIYGLPFRALQQNLLSRVVGSLSSDVFISGIEWQGVLVCLPRSGRIVYVVLNRYELQIEPATEHKHVTIFNFTQHYKTSTVRKTWRELAETSSSAETSRETARRAMSAVYSCHLLHSCTKNHI